MAEVIEQTNDKLVIRRQIPASREEVFAAWTDPDSIRHWMCPSNVSGTEAQIDLRVGGAYRILMKGTTEDYDHSGVYRVIDPPSKLVFTWISKGTDLAETLVTVELREHGGGTELTLTHERFPKPEKVRPHIQGWSEIVDLLAEHLGRRANPRDFRLVFDFKAPAGKVYQQFATQQGVRNWWTRFCEMDERVGGQASFRFPKAGFYAIVKIGRLEPERLVEWECVDSKHPENSGFIDMHDWIGTRLRFEIHAIDSARSRLTFTHVGLAPLECFGTCSSLWSFYLGQSLRGYLETGAGQPSVAEAAAV